MAADTTEGQSAALRLGWCFGEFKFGCSVVVKPEIYAAATLLVSGGMNRKKAMVVTWEDFQLRLYRIYLSSCGAPKYDCRGFSPK